MKDIISVRLEGRIAQSLRDSTPPDMSFSEAALGFYREAAARAKLPPPLLGISSSLSRLKPMLRRLEWNWRLLDLAPPSDPEESKVALFLRQSHKDTETVLFRCQAETRALACSVAALTGHSLAKLTQLQEHATEVAQKLVWLPKTELGSLAGLLYCVGAVSIQGTTQPPLPIPTEEPERSKPENPYTGLQIKLHLGAKARREAEINASKCAVSLNHYVDILLQAGMRQKPAAGKDELVFSALESAIVVLEGQTHTALSCYFAAEIGLAANPSEEHAKLIRRIHVAAANLRHQTLSLLHLVAGVAAARNHDFRADALSCYPGAQRILKAQMARFPTTPAEKAMLDYLFALGFES